MLKKKKNLFTELGRNGQENIWLSVTSSSQIFSHPATPVSQ